MLYGTVDPSGLSELEREAIAQGRAKRARSRKQAPAARSEKLESKQLMVLNDLTQSHPRATCSCHQHCHQTACHTRPQHPQHSLQNVSSSGPNSATANLLAAAAREDARETAARPGRNSCTRLAYSGNHAEAQFEAVALS